jgi:hypothetical protein
MVLPLSIILLSPVVGLIVVVQAFALILVVSETHTLAGFP